MTVLALTAILTAGPTTTTFQHVETQATVEAWEYGWYEHSPDVARLQALLGVEQDGIYGPDTWAAHGARLDWRGADDTRPQLPPRSTAPTRNLESAAPNPSFAAPAQLDGVPYGHLIAAYFPPADWAWAAAVLVCESGGNPNAYNSSSGASGLFQHLERFWPGRAAAAGWAGADVFDPTANTAVAAWLLAQGGRSHWVCRG